MLFPVSLSSLPNESLGILGVVSRSTQTRFILPYEASLSFRNPFCFQLPPHRTSRSCSCLQLVVAFRRPHSGLPPPSSSSCPTHFGCARLAPLLIASAHPEGENRDGRRAIYRKTFIPTESPLGKAISYTLGQWTALQRSLEEGVYEIDNNLVENAIRPTCIGKKNWLFIGHPDAGWRSAAIYSV